MNTSRISLLLRSSLAPAAAPFAVLVAALAALAGNASAASAPEYRAFRGLAMGNAFVAVVDDKDALYYNPAGLNLINALGNASSRPSLAGYPRNRFNARMNAVGATAPMENLLDFYSFYKKHKTSFSNDSAYKDDPELFDDIGPFDRRPVEIGVLHGAEFAMHNFGAAYWLDTRVAPYPDEGILLPRAGIETIQMDAAVQVALARGFLNNRLAVGAGYRVVNRQTVKEFEVGPSEIAEDGGRELKSRVIDTLKTKLKDLNDFSTYGQGVDLGLLWQQTSWLRFGAAVQSLGMYLNHELITPEFTVGAVVTPPVLSTGGMFARKVNLAVDFEDALSRERNYRLLSKINFGAEVEQHFWWIASVRLSGGAKGGYWSAGTGISLLTAVHIEYATWAEEAGYYTGNIENRYHALRIGMGI
jgi:hypothetical protein